MNRLDLLPPGPGWDLTPAERRLVECAASGECWEPSVPSGTVWNSNPAEADSWPSECVLRAEVIRCLVTGTRWTATSDPWPLDPKSLQIRNAKIDGDLDLQGCELLALLVLDRCAVSGSIRLREAKTRSMAFNGSHVASIDARRTRVDGSVHLRAGFRAKGVNLADAAITGHLSCVGGYFYSRGGTALCGTALSVGADVFLNDGFCAIGEVNLAGAKIGGGLRCGGGYFWNEGATALQCTAVSVGANVFLDKCFYAVGEVNFFCATIAGAFCCEGRFENAGDNKKTLNGSEKARDKKKALNCFGITVGSYTALNRRFQAFGEVDFVGATITGNVHLRGGRFHNAGGTALRLASASIGGELRLLEVGSVDGDLDFRYTEARLFHDDRSAWPISGSVFLDGFIYQRFGDSASKADWKTRLQWLEKQTTKDLSEDFRTQPWAQLIKVLREMGHESDARQIAIEREKKMACRPGRSWGRKTLDWLRGITVGYGYKPGCALYWSLGVALFGWLTFASAANLGYMAPRAAAMVTHLAQRPSEGIPDTYTRFNALIYAADVYLPVIELGQDSAWEPSSVPHGHIRQLQEGDGLMTCTGRMLFGDNLEWTRRAPVNARSCGFATLSWPAKFIAEPLFAIGFHRFVYWVTQILGWIFISLFIAGMSGIMKRE